MRVDFYHLLTSPLERALPSLVLRWRRGGRRTHELAAPLEVGATTRREEAVVTDAHEARRQDMLEKSLGEVGTRQRPQSVSVIASRRNERQSLRVIGIRANSRSAWPRHVR